MPNPMVPWANKPEEPKKMVPWAQEAYQIPGVDQTVPDATDPATRDRVWKESIRRLAGNKETRRKALAEIQTPEELAIAYGFKPEDFNPADLEENFNAFKGYGYGQPQQKKGALGSFAESAGAGIAAPLAAIRQGFAHGRAALTDSPEAIKARNKADLDARMYAEYKGASTEDHPVASTAGTVAGATPWALAAPAQTLGGATASGFALGALTPETSPGNYFLQTLARGGVGAAGGAAGNLLARGLITGGSKGVAAARGAIPEENLALQNQILEGLPIPPEQVTAANIVTSNGVKTLNSKITRHRDLASLSGSRLPRIDEANRNALNLQLEGLRGQAQRELAQTPFAAEGGELGPLTPGEAIQGSLPMEKGIRQQTITGPAYAAVPPKPPDSTIPHGSFVSNLEQRLGDLEAMGAGSPYSAPLTAQGESPIKLLQQQLANIKGKPGQPAVAPEMVWPPEVQELITKQGYPEDIFIKQGIQKIPVGGTPAQAGSEGMNTVYGLRQILENLQHGRTKYNTVGGNKLTHPITETINDLESTLQPAMSSPEWAAHNAGMSAADRLHATYVAPYNQPLLKGLIRKGGQAGEEVLPGNAIEKAVSFSPDEMALLSRSLEQKGQAGLRAGLFDDLVAAATDPTKPIGMQIDPKLLLQKLQNWQGRSALKSDQLTQLDNLTRALELMDQIGSRNPPITGTIDALTGLSSQRSIMKAIAEFLARKTDWAQTSTRGKAMLLTPSAATDPALAGTTLQRFLQGIQSGASVSGVPLQERLFGQQNPVDRSQFE